MPFLDRFWRLQRLYALLMIVLAAAGAFWYVRYMLPLEQQLNQFVVADAAFMLLLVGVYLLFAFNGLRLSQAALHRMQRRWQAIESQEEAVPLSRITLGTTPSEVFPEPNLYFTWPVTWSSRVSAVFEIAVAIGIPVFWGYLAWQSLATLLHVTASATSEYRLYLTHPVLAGVTWWLILCAASLPFGAFSDTSLLGLVKPLDMYVDDQGITWRNMFGVSRTLLWDEARLFEVSGRAVRQSQYGPLHYSHIYALHTRQTTIYWEERTHAIGSPSLRYLQLAEFIHARTGLRPRTLDPDLLAPDEPPLASPPRDLILDLLLTGEGAASIIMGFSDNTSAAPGFKVIGFVFLGIWAASWISSRIRTRRAHRQQSPSAQQSNASAARVDDKTFATADASHIEAPPLSVDMRYGLTTGSRWTFNYNRAIFAMIAAIIPAYTLLLVVEEVLAQVIHLPGLHLYPVLPAILITVLLASALGLMTLVSVLRAQPITIIADEQGLHRIGMFGQQLTIQWPEVTAIEARDMFGKPAFYTVRTATVGTSIMWMARPLTHRQPGEHLRAQAITPEELAALVAAQTGKQWNEASPRG